MARFFVPVEMWYAETAELPESEARHASQVLRLEVGDRVEIFDGTGRAAEGRGFVPVDLGKHVLRSETAALHVLSAAVHQLHGGVGGKR